MSESGQTSFDWAASDVSNEAPDECIIECYHRGKKGPISLFIVDDDVYYKEVFRHLKSCTVCSPQRILESYLARRRATPKFYGMTSKSLVELALRYERHFNIPKDLVDEFIWRSGPDFFALYSDRLTLLQIYEGTRLSLSLQKSKGYTVGRWDQVALRNLSPEALTIVQNAEFWQRSLTEKELQDMIQVVSVMAT